VIDCVRIGTAGSSYPARPPGRLRSQTPAKAGRALSRPESVAESLRTMPERSVPYPALPKLPDAPGHPVSEYLKLVIAFSSAAHLWRYAERDGRGEDAAAERARCGELLCEVDNARWEAVAAGHLLGESVLEVGRLLDLIRECLYGLVQVGPDEPDWPDCNEAEWALAEAVWPLFNLLAAARVAGRRAVVAHGQGELLALNQDTRVPRPALPSTAACRLSVRGQALLLDGEAVTVNAAADGRTSLLAVLADLIAHPGGWRTGSEIAADAEKAGVVLNGRRICRYLRLAPPAVMELIDSDRRKGYILLPEAWRR
jgi:hypothetical protein